jgi:cell wall-associated protease
MKTKRNILSLFFLLFIGNVYSQNYFYGENGEKVKIELDNSRFYIVSNKSDVSSLLKVFPISINEIETPKKLIIGNSLRLIDYKKDSVHYTRINNDISKYLVNDPEILYFSPSFRMNGKLIGASQFIYVKLKKEDDRVLLEGFAERKKMHIVGQDKNLPLWYVLSCDVHSNGNSVELANEVFESGLFESSQPDLLDVFEVACRNDSYFTDQWGLNSNGQHGALPGSDIRACNAWGITTGCSNIIVAVLDEGLELNHPDFNNIVPFSYNTLTASSPSVIHGNHGVPVAGIIGAHQNNNLGISGVAPNGSLMSISHSFSAPLSPARLADGMITASQNGAQIINNSWSSGVFYQVIDDAINQITVTGRNNLGVIVVQSVGNGNQSTVAYPSNNPRVIAVGASNMLNQRKSTTSNDGDNSWGSNYGQGLDVVAPGLYIPSTDRQGNNGYNTNSTSNEYSNRDFTNKFKGTSAAVPHISGIAALILSLNPNFTATQVKNIIESSTDKFSGYSFSLGAGENAMLTWNTEVGYGKVNAHLALLEAAKMLIQGPDYLCSTNSFIFQNLPAGYTASSWAVTPTRLFSDPTSGTGSSATLTPYHTNTSGQATITFTVTTPCGSVQIQRPFWVGKPAVPGPITGNTSPGPGSLTPYYINNLPSGATSMTWSLPYCVGCSQPWSFYSGQNDILITANVGDSDGYVQTMGVNACGTGGASLLYVTTNGPCNPCPRMYPNPVSNEMTLEWMDAEGFVMSEEIDSYQVSLYNAVGGIILTETTNNPSIKIDLSQLKNGFYYLHIENKDGLIRKQIRVER